MRKILFLVLTLILSLTVSAKVKYKITLQVDGNHDTMMLIGYHYAENTYVFDTAYNNGRGKFVFEGENDIKPGLFFFSNNKNRFIEFVYYHEKPNFKFITKDEDWTEYMKVKGSEQNEVMFNYQKKSNAMYKELVEAQKRLDSAAFITFRNNQFHRIDSLKMSLVIEHPDAMIGKMIFATKDVDVPITKADGSKMSDRERYNYLMAHYFDNMPLDDDFIVRTPKEIFYNRVMEYTDKNMRGMPPAMICPLLDSMIDRSEKAPEVFKWMVHTMTEKYLQSPVMVYDEVYVHLIKRYYMSGKAFWASPSFIDEQAERANKWEKLLVGKEPPELILFDTLDRAYSLLHTQGDYTLLLFWSPTCGHCREIIPAMYNVFVGMRDSIDITAFTVLSEFDEGTVVKWKQFMVSHKMNNPYWLPLNGALANIDWHDVYDITSTPQVYLIENKTHTIIAKKLNANLLNTIAHELKTRNK